MLEGQRLTRELARAGIAVELGVDAALAMFTEHADMALVGADSVTVGGVVNKLGDDQPGAGMPSHGHPLLRGCRSSQMVSS